jgi:hypothetical protein
MKSPRQRIIDAMANMMLEAGLQAIESISPPTEPVTYVEVPSQRSLPPAPPAQRVVPEPAQAGAQPDPNLHPFPFPPPLQLPPAEGTQPALLNGQQQGPRSSGKPRKKETTRPQLFLNGRNPQGPPPTNGRNGHNEE